MTIPYAVKSTRVEPASSLDDFPTPPWATRLFCDFYFGGVTNKTCLEPAANRGYMVKSLSDFFHVTGSDIFDYGSGFEVRNFLDPNSYDANSFDWVITNPPFIQAEFFLKHGLRVAREGVAIFTRTVFIESKGRFERVFSKTPPTYFLPYVERVPLVKGRVDIKAVTATSYCWLVWDKRVVQEGTELKWLPPNRKKFELKGDYERMSV